MISQGPLDLIVEKTEIFLASFIPEKHLKGVAKLVGTTYFYESLNLEENVIDIAEEGVKHQPHFVIELIVPYNRDSNSGSYILTKRDDINKPIKYGNIRWRVDPILGIQPLTNFERRASEAGNFAAMATEFSQLYNENLGNLNKIFLLDPLKKNFIGRYNICVIQGIPALDIAAAWDNVLRKYVGA